MDDEPKMTECEALRLADALLTSAPGRREACALLYKEAQRRLDAVADALRMWPDHGETFAVALAEFDMAYAEANDFALSLVPLSDCAGSA